MAPDHQQASGGHRALSEGVVGRDTAGEKREEYTAQQHSRTAEPVAVLRLYNHKVLSFQWLADSGIAPGLSG
jgi:hypothetical protein